MPGFRLAAPYQPAGDQPAAIERLTAGIASGMKKQTLLGVTGSGKTYTIAAAVEKLQRPTLVLTHNKTLAAQLYREFKDFFPDNAVEYFVSYYDYYQPEAYVASTDTYIEKDSSINDEIDLMRLSATSSLLARRDVLIVASVSCIYGLGSPEQYRELVIPLTLGMEMDRNELVRRLVAIQYERSDAVPLRSTFRVRGDVVDILPAYDKNSIRVSFFGDEIERLQLLEKVSGRVLLEPTSLVVYPAKHFVTTKEILVDAVKRIQDELEERLAWFRERGRLVEAHRLEQRTRFDLEMLQEIGYCKGIENYSRHISGRAAGERPAVLLDYFPEDFLVFVDESHVSLPQLQGMYRGDRARKENLVEYGFRLPSALDNRPLFFEEFETMARQTVYVSATPGNFERSHAAQTVELIIRPTGLVDPPIEVRPSEGQIDDLLGEINRTSAAGYRTLVTTLTKRMSEELTAFLAEHGIRVRYLHSEIETIERVEILHDLRAGVFDVLVGINLLREGLDLPEVALVAILDADKIGFLRSAPALIQTAGRAARNVAGRVLMYAERVSEAMETAIGEMERRRAKQLAWNAAHGITPRTIEKEVGEILYRRYAAVREHAPDFKKLAGDYDLSVAEQRLDYERKLEERMHTAAENLEFEQAAAIRDELARLRGKGGAAAAPRPGRKR